MANRRGANWVLESAPWAAGKARVAVVGQLGKWGYRPAPEVVAAVEAVVTLLVEQAVGDGGARVTVHVSDQGRQVCVLALSHQTAPTAPATTGGPAAGGDEDVLHRITAHQAVTGCGTDTGPDGRRTWAVLDL
ncbi:hypothetical protein ABZ802_31530 [Streptomyces sp. NPDC047737]|uniref:hypothetical protein n=1 Tax=Streptomyces sp. NPDC047737 TaxID=3155740 RepID=UPI0033DB5D70